MILPISEWQIKRTSSTTRCIRLYTQPHKHKIHAKRSKIDGGGGVAMRFPFIYECIFTHTITRHISIHDIRKTLTHTRTQWMSPRVSLLNKETAFRIMYFHDVDFIHVCASYIRTFSMRFEKWIIIYVPQCSVVVVSCPKRRPYATQPHNNTMDTFSRICENICALYYWANIFHNAANPRGCCDVGEHISRRPIWWLWWLWWW